MRIALAYFLSARHLSDLPGDGPNYVAVTFPIRLYRSSRRGHPLIMIEVSEQQIIDQLTGRLVHIYREVEPDRISQIVHQEHGRFDGRPIRDFIPLFVERNAKAELAKLDT